MKTLESIKTSILATMIVAVLSYLCFGLLYPVINGYLSSVLWSNVFTGLIYAGIILGLNRLYIYLLFRDDILSLFPIEKGREVLICYGNVQIKNNDDIAGKDENDSACFDYGDTRATFKVYNKFINVKPEIVTTNANSEKLENNVITVGGPKWNKVTEKLIGEMGSPLYYKVGISGLIKEIPDISKDILTYEKKNREVEDYGSWIFEKGDKSKGSRLIISGYSTWGVLIAAEALHRLKDLDDYRFLKGKLKKEKRFAVIFRGKVVLNEDGTIADIGKPILKKQLIIRDEAFFKTIINYNYEKGHN